MQLTQLEIKGFKSFGDKVTINFNEGITAIVGPNGCGKSNVVDAIRWVLGEQSTKALRSEKMENIIFNGTKTRKAAQLAEVSLSFNNTKNILSTAFSQITITRKLYRSGESEYRLNDVQCRLKDINDLFLDTGIGSDSYAIIELKMVEEIINNKEHSRRSLFEEAAGISKYKVRKKQTIAKLKETENDLSRVDDLLYEIEKNLKTLESQARKAERYYKIKEQYKLLSLSLATLKTESIQQSLQRIEQQNLEEETQRTAIATEIATAEAILQKLKNETLVKEQNLSIQQKIFNQKLADIRNFETDKKIKNEQLYHLKEREDQLNKSIQQDKQQRNHVLYQLKRLQEELSEANSKLDHVTTDLTDQSKDIEKIRIEENNEKEILNTLSREKNELEHTLYDVEKHIAVINIQREALTQESQRTLSDEQNRELELGVFNEKLDQLNQQITTLQEKERSSKKAEATLQDELSKTEKELNALQEQNHQQSRLLDAKKNEYNLTKSLIDNLEGFPESIKFLRKNAKWAKDTPLFSDILLCKEEYRIAIENLLEPYMNFYIADTLQDALSAVHLLHKSGKGRAGFFVLETISPILKEARDHPQNLVPALAVIDVDAKYKTLCHQLLSQVYILEHPVDSTFTEKLPEGDITVLNKQGNYIANRLSIAGGSVGLFDGKRIGRTKNLELLAKEIKKLGNQQENNLANIALKTESLGMLKTKSQKTFIEEIQHQLHTLRNEHISIKTKQEQYEAFLQNASDRKKAIEEKIDSLEKDLGIAGPQFSSLQQRLQLFQSDFIEKQEKFSIISEKLSHKTTLYNEANINVHQQKNRVKGIEKDIDYRRVQIETLEKQLKQKESSLQEVQSNIQKTLKHVDASDGDLHAMYEQKNAIEKGLQEFERDYYQFRGNITTQEENTTTLRKKKEVSDTLINEIKEEKTRLTLNLNALKERLSIEFSIELEDLELVDRIQEDEVSLQTKLEKIKKQIDEFGAINPMAMEAFQEMDKRYQFILKEKNDLLEAKSTLLETIQEIDESAEDKFMAAFMKVRENFITVFRSLFSEEDACDLIINDSVNPLEADIEIIAKPKGKKPLSINQLSGGEKTLTATALLFSLYLLKPAPFCIFDEVDAPLDDSNIDKFNNIIRDFSDNSQFIIVSHNKRTIASTDIIYGVTMVESGISRVVAVDMREV